MSEHWEQQVARLCIRQEKDYPNSPIDINMPIEQQGWWEITLNVHVLDDKVIEVVVEEMRKWP